MSVAASTPPTPDVSIRAHPPSPKRLSRKVLLAGALGIGGMVAAALLLGLSDRPDRRHAETNVAATAAGPPDSIQSASAEYDVRDLSGPELEPPRDMLWGAHAQPPDPAALQPPEDPAWSARGAGETAAHGSVPPDPQTLARASSILFRADGHGGSPGESAAAQGAVGGSRSAFLTSQRNGVDERLEAKLSPPRSRYELLSGAVIPAALVTALNSDLPGRVIAQVTAPVYDSVSGDHLLIPQGARLLGTYDNATTYGDRRLLLVWNRLIFPNGWSISLRGMEGADPSGAAGLGDRADQHLDRLAGAIGLSAVISVVANEAQDKKSNSFTQSVGDAAAQEAARTGGRIVDRELAVRPTLRVRAGGAVRVLVTRDIQLRPYRGGR